VLADKILVHNRRIPSNYSMVETLERDRFSGLIAASYAAKSGVILYDTKHSIRGWATIPGGIIGC
jgi:hypothetical protein